MEAAAGRRGRDGGSQRRSPLDVIMSQIRRKRTASDRKPLRRFLSQPSEQSDIPEDREPEAREDRARGPEAAGEREPGWGRVCVFLQRLGRTVDGRSLSLAHCDLTATDLLELGDALSCVPLLDVLDLSWNPGAGGGLSGLLGNLRPPLRELHLVACELTAAAAAALGEAAAALPTLCVLDVSCNPQLTQGADAGGFRELASGLAGAAALTTLRLQACGLTPGCLHALGRTRADTVAPAAAAPSWSRVSAAGASLHGLSSMRELDLSCNRGVAGGLRSFTLHLSHLMHLESLDLHQCSLTRDDLEALVQVLPSLTALVQLDVSSNKEAGGVVHQLVSVLPLAQMRRLPLNGCSLDPESYAALALAAPHLRAVDVSWCKVVGGRSALLLDALQTSVILELRLSSCELKTEDAHHLAAGCRRGCLSSLRVLDVSYNGAVAADGWAAVFAAGGLGSLEEVDLSLRPSTSAPCAAWLPDLVHALPRLAALSRLAAQRWSISAKDRHQLHHSLRRRSVLLEWDPDIKDATSASGESS
ncbi:leucine-rich repeat-containing protein 31 isoform X3 [Betta splendens]|uniref:Leucine-rich repeat-containing protein 31 isoform X3 n=1 Tax=Betta splendens TaxID=158456 RepID=A0A6P7M5F4_BETSP|nr:leucine-rich repeat-containing protein 31 isoform X3 [Betta splendens]